MAKPQRSLTNSGQRGVALIMVLLAMALVTLIAAGMAPKQELRIFSAGHYLAQQQGYSIALGAEAFANRILVRDFEDDKEDNGLVDSLDELWASNSAVLPVETTEEGDARVIAVAEVQIDGLGGRLNLNDLVPGGDSVDPVSKDRFSALLEVLEITEFRVDALIDWIDTNDQTITAYGAEDGRYLVADPAYRAANQPFTSVTELRLIEGMTEEAYRALLPHVAALPVSGAGINVNTATAEVIAALHTELSLAQGKAVVEKRAEEPFETVQEFLKLDEFAGLGLKTAGLKVNTHFFEVVSRITYDNRVANLISTVYRSPEGEMQTVRRDTGQKNRITKEPVSVPE
ncbi:type II secretion system minor pseudopilin GspK [Marinobacter sp. CHS3-4]|uniref:type II secretion system minor pseudopilin GspK n=1 Tax=Marinobacter sp. CHS3-4 TaxID=3045174 RepID=UPI0024B5E61A|nr:type II secretion system minor pseudopilin GspK [Marinobacter sp. CHS3-4]MDI9245299.1 type II secretion system minor pseudopilin GspK [Marinobacter sp. CHS3-4]